MEAMYASAVFAGRNSSGPYANEFNAAETAARRIAKNANLFSLFRGSSFSTSQLGRDTRLIQPCLSQCNRAISHLPNHLPTNVCGETSADASPTTHKITEKQETMRSTS